MYQPPNNEQQPYSQYVPLQRKKKPRTWLWITALLVVFLFGCGPGHTGDSSTATNTSAGQPTPPAIATSKPTARTQSNGLPAPTSGPTLLGSPLSNFLGRYGTPMDLSTQKSNMFEWQHGDVTVFTDPDKPYRVNAVLYDGADGTGWSSVDVASPNCRAFLPTDSTYKRTIDITGSSPALERVYYSPSLGGLFPASEFVDENGNNTTPGLFAVVYLYDMTNVIQVDSCSIQIGLQGN